MHTIDRKPQRLGDEYILLHKPDGVISIELRIDHTETFGSGVIPTGYKIQSIGVKHLTEVASHAVNTISGSRSHVLHFVNGGILRFAYSIGGSLIALEFEMLRCEISEKNEVLFYI